MKDIDLRRLAVLYLKEVHAGYKPTPALAEEFGIGRATVARYIQAARAEGLLPAGQKGSATPSDGDHWPRVAIFPSQRGRWLACLACHETWPCADPATLRWLNRIDPSSVDKSP